MIEEVLFDEVIRPRVTDFDEDVSVPILLVLRKMGISTKRAILQRPKG